MSEEKRPTIPYSQSQTVAMRYLELGDIEEWLDGLVHPHTLKGETPYYLHIDHCQILPVNEDGFYPVLAIYHRVYLQPGA